MSGVTQAAHRMRSFYEPGYFGQKGATSYGDAMAAWGTMPVEMGGFAFDVESPLSGAADPFNTFGKELEEQVKLRRAFDGPDVGLSNLDSYGKGQLENYGRGALDAYGAAGRTSRTTGRTR